MFSVKIFLIFKLKAYIGDSLLNYMSKQEIQNGIDDTKDMYSLK